MKIDEIYAKVARDLGVTSKHVRDIHQGYWAAVREYISSLPLKEDISEEDFLKLRTSVNIPSLGKFYVEWTQLKNKKEEYERYKNNKVKTSV